MHSHPNARLTPIGRERLICRHLDDGVPLKALAAEAGITLRSAYKWLARFRDGGLAALADRRSVRRTQRRTLDPQQLQHAMALRQGREVHQNTPGGMGLRHGVPDLRGAEPLATSLSGNLEQPQVPHGSRWPHPSAVLTAAADH